MPDSTVGHSDDRDLPERLRQGEDSAFDEVFRAWYVPLVRQAHSMLRDRAAAETVVQDVMLELWLRREQLAAEEPVQAHLFRFTRSRVLSHLNRHPPEDGPEAPAGATKPFHRDAEMDAALRRALGGLPRLSRQVFELSRIRGLTYAEISELLGIPEQSVEEQMGSALRAVRQQLAPWLPRSSVL
jgi:RNA polymerase sigma-70 factor (ECF subfamily)